jgi:hypothetical protein
MQDTKKSALKVHLIQSDDAEPRVKLTSGKRFEVVATPIVDCNFDAISEEAAEPQARPPRLCGSRSTCVAIVEID